MQQSTWKYFPKQFLECNQAFENIFLSLYNQKIFYMLPNIGYILQDSNNHPHENCMLSFSSYIPASQKQYIIAIKFGTEISITKLFSYLFNENK